MSLPDMIEKASGSIFGWAVVTVGGGVIWIIRRVFTNQKQIEMLQREIEMRDQRRAEDRGALNEVRTDVKELRAEIRNLFRNER